jgi:SNF2 family DNA or RNA helicase
VTLGDRTMNHVGLQHVTISEYHDMLAHNCSMMLIMYKQKIFAWEWYGCGLSAFDCPAPPLVTANSQTKIIGAKAAFIRGFSLNEEAFKQVLAEGAGDISLVLTLEANSCILRLHQSDTKLAVLDKRSTSTLQNIISKFGAQIHVFKHNESRHEPRKELRYPSRGTMIPLMMNIFGTKENAKAIGAELSRSRFYLQHPYFLETSIKYENPHIFLYKSKKDKSEKLTPNNTPSGLQGPTIDAPKDEKEATVIEQILQASIQVEGIREFEADSRVQTELLSHQKQALYFIHQQETNSIEQLSLWTKKEMNGRPFYEHKITGFRTMACPADNSGGILADDMGLGKTLSTIAAIVGSLDDAKTYSQNSEGSIDCLSSGATLVLAPSVGMRLLRYFPMKRY